MCSEIRLIHWVIWKFFLDFQFWKSIFLVIVREMSNGFLCFGGKGISVMAPRRRSEEDNGILQPKIVESPARVHLLADPRAMKIIISAVKSALWTGVCVSQSHFKHFTLGDVGPVNILILHKLKICVSGHRYFFCIFLSRNQVWERGSSHFPTFLLVVLWMYLRLKYIYSFVMIC